MYKRYLRQSLMLFIGAMGVIGCINFVVDPGNIYLNKLIANLNSQSYANAILLSSRGIVQSGWNDRYTKVALAKKAGEAECVLLGSSHVMQISRVRETGEIEKQCGSLLNLGVSGGSFEDLLVFSNIILNQSKLPRYVYIAIDPWTLKFQMDSRYGAYQDDYQNMLTNLNSNIKLDSTEYLRKIIFNLFNAEYLNQSLNKLFETKKVIPKNDGNEKIVFPDSVFSYDKGYKFPVTLPDGSHVYSRKWILTQKGKIKSLAVGGGSYKITGDIYDEKALFTLKQLIDFYQMKGVQVSIIMTPYHPRVFLAGETKPVMHMKVVDKLVRELAKREKVKVYGSFFPNVLDCKEDEFYDFMHATSACLNRIDFSK